MPQRKDSKGWQPPSTVKLRKGQQQVIDLLSKPGSSPRKNGKLVAELPTGYGKTYVICAAYALLREQGAVGRMLVVVPSDEQFNSYLEEIESDLADLGAPISGALKASSALGLKAHKENTAEVFVTTVQSLTSNEDAITDLLKTGLWLLAADEYHRYAKDNTWGKSLVGLNSVFTLAVSATPDRTDGGDKAIEGAPDVRVTLREAVEEGAIRPVVVRSSSYAIDLTMRGEDTPRRMSTSELRKALAESGADISTQEVKKELRYYSKYLYKAILDPYIKLNQLNAEQPGEHKMLVFAMGVGHAKSVCEQVNGIAGEKIADWIGVQSTVERDDGKAVVIGRSEKENKDVLDKFKSGEFNVLVQVKKATEGFNDVRCSVLLFLNLTGESVQLKQMIGRGLRRNYAVEPAADRKARKDRCWIYVSNDHPGLEYMKRLEGEMAHEDDDDDDEGATGGGGSGTPIYGIPEFYILDARFSGEELFYPFGDDGQISEAQAIARAREGTAELADASDETIQAHLRRLFGMEPKPVSTTEKISRARKKVTDSARMLGGNVVRVRAERCGGTFPQSLLGDTIRGIHAKWLRHNPSLSHDSMSVEDFERKYEWIRGINNRMKAAPDAYQFLMSEAAWLLL